VRVLPQAHIAWTDAALRSHCRRFHDDEARSSDRPAAEVDQMPVVGEAVLAGVLAHGRDGNAIGEGNAALGERGEQVGDGLGHGFSW
jgi:hypothetical protein